MKSVFLSVLQSLVTIFVNPKLPFEAVSNATRLPNNPHIRITYASSLITPSSVETHLNIKSCFQRTIAPTIDPAIRKASHFFVVIAPITITSTINVAINP